MNGLSKSSSCAIGTKAIAMVFGLALAAAAVLAVSPKEALAADTISAKTYLDTNNNGQVETIRLTMDENVTACAYEAGDWAVSVAGTINVTAISGISCTGADAILNITVTAGAGITGGATSPTITYTNQGTAGSVTLTSGAMTAKTVDALTDAAKPVITAVQTTTSSSRNVVTFTYTEAVTADSAISTANLGDTTAAGTVAGMGDFATNGDITTNTTKNSLSGSGTSTITVILAGEVGGFITDGGTHTVPSGNVTPLAHASLHDSANNTVNTAAAAVASSAGTAWVLTQPTVSSITLSEATGKVNGKIDRATIVFSANMRGTNLVDGEALLGGATHTGTFSGHTDTTSYTFDLSTDNLAVNTTATAAQFTYTAVTAKITDAYGNLLNTGTDGSIANADVVEADGANPVIVSTTPAHGADSVAVSANIVVDFSETMSIGACAITSSPSVSGLGDITSAGNWDAGASTLATSRVTLAHTGSYNQRTTVVITISGCTAAAGPAALVANSSASVSNPWNFRTLSTGTVSGGGGGAPVVVNPSISITIPVTSASYKNGVQLGLSWTSANGPFVKYKVSYSSNNGNSWTVLTDAAANTSYTWTIPDASTTQGLIKVEGLASDGSVLAAATSGAFTVNGTQPAPAPVDAPASTTPPANDPTVTGAYTPSTARANTPDINTDKTLPAAEPFTAWCVSGTLVKGSAPAVYYCGADGKRYVFVNDKAYFSWYSDFSTVQTIADETLAKITIGGNVTYRPGSRMVKVQSDPKVYAVSRGGVLRWVATEAAAKSLYGNDWSKMIDDVPDSFFVNYKVGEPLSQ